MPFPIIVEETENCFSDCIGTLERDNHASVIRKQLLRVPIGGRDDRLPCSQSDCKRPGYNLRLLLVRGNVNIGRAHLLNQFLSANKPINEDQVRGNS